MYMMIFTYPYKYLFSMYMCIYNMHTCIENKKQLQLLISIYAHCISYTRMVMKVFLSFFIFLKLSPESSSFYMIYNLGSCFNKSLPSVWCIFIFICVLKHDEHIYIYIIMVLSMFNLTVGLIMRERHISNYKLMGINLEI